MFSIWKTSFNHSLANAWILRFCNDLSFTILDPTFVLIEFKLTCNLHSTMFTDLDSSRQALVQLFWFLSIRVKISSINRPINLSNATRSICIYSYLEDQQQPKFESSFKLERIILCSIWQSCFIRAGLETNFNDHQLGLPSVRSEESNEVQIE